MSDINELLAEGVWQPSLNPRRPVTRRALLQRLNRRLAREEGGQVRTSRSERMRRQFGDYHLTRNNVIIDGFSDLEAWGRAEGVLAGWEYVW
jgi:hypothetical protein